MMPSNVSTAIDSYRQDWTDGSVTATSARLPIYIRSVLAHGMRGVFESNSLCAAVWHKRCRTGIEARLDKVRVPRDNLASTTLSEILPELI